MDKTEVNRIAYEWPEWTDMLGNVYRPGDHGVYATVSGHSPMLCFGQVVKINRLKKNGEAIVSVDRTWNKQTSSWSTNSEPSCSLTIKPIEYATRGQNHSFSNTKKLTTIQHPNRFVKVESNYVTRFEELRNALSLGQEETASVDALGGAPLEG